MRYINWNDSMGETPIFFRRNLPHYQPAGATFFITFRLAGSLPVQVIQKLKAERLQELKAVGQDNILSYKIQKKYFGKFDGYLDRANQGQAWLAQDEIACVVAEALHFWDGKRYSLICFCIMPNHVHLVIETANDPAAQVNNLRYILSPVLHSIKRYTARAANLILHRTGEFWQHESYDHLVRDADEFERIDWYVVDNPVKAGLANQWSEWRWTFVRPELLGDVLE